MHMPASNTGQFSRRFVWQAGAGNGNDDDPYFVIGSGNVAGTVALASGPDNDETASRILHVEQDDLQWSTLFPNVADDEAELREMTLPDILDMAIACAGDDCDGAVEDAEAWRVLRYMYLNSGQKGVGGRVPLDGHRSLSSLVRNSFAFTAAWRPPRLSSGPRPDTTRRPWVRCGHRKG